MKIAGSPIALSCPSARAVTATGASANPIRQHSSLSKRCPGETTSRSGSPNFRSPTAAHRAATALSMVCATTQPTALPIRCSGACVLQKRFVPQRSNLLQRGAAWRGATEPAAAQHVLQRGATCCNRPQPAATCCSAVQRVHRQSGPMQRSTTCCNRPQFAAMGHSALQPVAAIATQCSPLQQQTTGICNRPRPVATDHGPLQ